MDASKCSTPASQAAWRVYILPDALSGAYSCSMSHRSNGVCKMNRCRTQALFSSRAVWLRVSMSTVLLGFSWVWLPCWSAYQGITLAHAVNIIGPQLL